MSEIEKMEKDIRESEESLFNKHFDPKEVFEFCYNHKVEVLLQDDLQYHCYIDYKEGRGSYYSTIRNPLTCIVVAIHIYKKHHNELTEQTKGD